MKHLIKMVGNGIDVSFELNHSVSGLLSPYFPAYIKDQVEDLYRSACDIQDGTLSISGGLKDKTQEISNKVFSCSQKITLSVYRLDGNRLVEDQSSCREFVFTTVDDYSKGY